MNPIHTHFQNFSAAFSYPVHFGRGTFLSANPLLADLLSGSGKVMVVVDQGVHLALPGFVAQIERWFALHPGLELICAPEVIPGGEALKNDYRRIMGLVDQMLEYHLCRHSTVLAIGGGALLDAVGFATSLVHRGLRLIRMPSTTLAQNDAGIGVKNGMNLHGGKNTIGVFAPPFAVINDFDLLEGLPEGPWRDGISEAFKVAMIKDAGFFRELIRLSPALGRREAPAMERLIIRCAELHLEHIATSGDPFEQGSARPLDFGHWSAHKLESMSGFRISHGQAVAIGITLDAKYAARLGWIPPEDAQALERALRICGFELNPPELSRVLGDGSLQLLQGLQEFQEHLGGTLTLSLPGPTGGLREIHEVNPEWMAGFVREMQESPCN
ncbi:MAG: 3-dehydroquinate synthase [Kiritimatiellia bacterium]